mgnify:CR=1 FL=1
MALKKHFSILTDFHDFWYEKPPKIAFIRETYFLQIWVGKFYRYKKILLF